MAYCTIEDVQARNPQRGAYTGSTPVTASQVGLFMDDAAGVIDTVLTQAGYTSPVSISQAPSSARLTLRNANAVGAAYMVEWAAPVSDRRKEYEDMWESALKMLRTMELDLPKDAAQSLPRSSGVATAYFTRDTVT